MIGKLLHSCLDVNPPVGPCQVAAIGLADAPKRVAERSPDPGHARCLLRYLVNDRLQSRETSQERLNGALDVGQLGAIRLRHECLALSDNLCLTGMRCEPR